MVRAWKVRTALRWPQKPASSASAALAKALTPWDVAVVVLRCRVEERRSILGSRGSAGAPARNSAEVMSDYVVLPPVDFDFAAAEAAAGACREMAERLDLVMSERARAGEAARARWEGSARKDFDAISDVLRSEGTDLRTQLLSTASNIEASAEDARSENRRRDEENVLRRQEAQRQEAQRAEPAAPAGRPR